MKFAKPTTEEELAEVYDHIYRNEPKYGRLVGRHRAIIKFVFDETAASQRKNSMILDAGCGRGDVMKHLRANGYNAQGTEVSRHLYENDLKNFPVALLRYDEFDKLPENSYDFVISSDVLEHMCDWDMVDHALYQFARICKPDGYACITTANHVSRNFSNSFETEGDWNGDLHLIHAPNEEWLSHVARFFGVEQNFTDARGNTFFFFGKPK